MTRRTLVLTDETARHPFLRSLPPHVRQGTEPVLAGTVREGIVGGGRWAAFLAELRQIMAVYCAGFLATITFFA